MKFVDEATIRVQAGNGGRGMVSFRREKFIPFGGPDGGDGGHGGSIYFVATQGLNTLADFRYRRAFKAPNGEPGGSADCSGRGGADLEVQVPVGTVIYDTETDETIGDLTLDGERVLVARRGERLVLLLKCWLPSPPLPPRATSTRSPPCARSPSTSSVSTS